MSDSGQEGFKQPIQEIDTVKVKPIASKTTHVCKYSPQLLLKNPVSLFYQVPLHFYPRNIDSAQIVTSLPPIMPSRTELLTKILKEDNESVDLSSFFTRKYFCIYNRFKQGFANKRDITILIRNPARHIRNDLYATFQEKVQRKRCRLAFSSQFEGGNLHYVFAQKNEELYYLLLQNDVNTHGYNYWFHFRLKANEQGRYNFVIVNITKEVLFEGLQVLLIFNPATGNFIKDVGYICRQTRFSRNNCPRNYWSLYFECQIKQKEQLYISLIRPYSYTKSMNFINNLIKESFANTAVTLHLPAKSEMGNLLPCLQISSSKSRSKKYVFITARQHPSQTVGSYICEAIIKKLTAQDEDSLKLLQKFTFFIVPMLNPDGVIHGNSRTNILGFDLNRCWTRYGIMQSRECQNIWKFVEESIVKDGKIHWCLDLHGHSRELGFFTYFGQRNEKSSLFNQILSKKCSYYSKQKAVFQVNVTKKQSIRGQLSQRLKVQNTLTIQASMFGFKNAENKFISFDEVHYSVIGANILLSVLQTEEKIKEVRIFSLKNSLKRFRQNQNRHEQALDSDSNPEEDYLLIEQRKQLYYIESENEAKTALRTQSCQRLVTEQIKTTINFKFNQNQQNQRNKMSLNKFQQLHAKNRGKTKLRSQSNKSISSHNFSNYQNRNKSSQEKMGSEQSSHINEGRNSLCLKIKRKENQAGTSKQSIIMRRKIKMAFQSKTKRQTSKEQIKSEVRSIVYPLGGTRQAQTKSFLRQKRGRMREIRLNQYGITVIRKFHNSLFMRSHRLNQ